MFVVYLQVCFIIFFFFFKQKTAYEMRISDWSSDVCSSDLSGIGGAALEGPAIERLAILIAADPAHQVIEAGFPCGVFHRGIEEQAAEDDLAAGVGLAVQGSGAGFRSEEHTSELQSLMRISYAVFCLKKKSNTNKTRKTVT